MKRLIFWFLMALGTLLCSDMAHAQYLTVTTPSNCITDGSGAPMTSGTMTVIGTDANDNPIPYRAGSSIMSTTAPITRTITNGALATSLQLADPLSTSPTNVLYRFAVQDNSTKRVTLYKQIVLTANDTLVGGVFTQFNFCKMNPLPFTNQVMYATGPLLVSGDQTITGTSTVGALLAGKINNRCMADQQTGADAGVKIAACIVALGSNGGIVDATGFIGAQTSSVNPFATQPGPIQLLLGNTTITTSVTWAPKSNAGTSIAGLNKLTTIIKSGVNLNAPTIDVNGFNNFEIKNLTVDGNKANQSLSTGLVVGIHVKNSSVFDCSNVLVQNTNAHGYFFETGFSNVNFIYCSANAPNNGSGALFGNAVGTSGSHVYITGGSFIGSSVANGLFFTGVVTDVIVNHVRAFQNADTGIEIGDGVIGYELSNCSVDLVSTGILLRSSQNGTVSNCYVTTSSPAINQIGIYIWNGSIPGPDSQPFKNIVVNANTVCGLTGGGTSADIAWSSDVATSTNLQVTGNTTCVSDTKRYDPRTTNITPLVLKLDNGTDTNNANNMTINPQAGGALQITRPVGVSQDGVNVTPGAGEVAHWLNDGASSAATTTIECGVDGDCGQQIKNSAQSWVSKVSGTTHEYRVRNITGGLDALILDTSGNETIAGKLIPSSTGGVVGTTTNNNATAGSIGEVISSTVATGSSITLTSGTAANITSISLTAGDWDCSGAVDYTFGATTSYTTLQGGLSTTSATLGGQDSAFGWITPAAVPTAAIDMTWDTPVVRESLASTTTVFLVTKATFTVSTLKAYGSLRCRRVR